MLTKLKSKILSSIAYICTFAGYHLAEGVQQRMAEEELVEIEEEDSVMELPEIKFKAEGSN